MSDDRLHVDFPKTIEIGILAPPLREQIPNLKNARLIQRLVDATNLLRVQGMLTKGESRKVDRRGVKKIASSLS